MNYTDVLLNYEIRKYKSIAIVGINKYIDNLIIEIAFLSDLDNLEEVFERVSFDDLFIENGEKI